MPEKRLVDLVNALLGTVGPGNCLVGPYRPFGMLRLGPDTFFPQPTNGYQPGQPIMRFSHTHVPGTGGCSRYGNVGITPFVGEPRMQSSTPFIEVPFRQKHEAICEEEEAAVGYYKALTKPFNIMAELTCTRHVGFHRYRFPDTQQQWLIVNAGSVIETGLSVGGHISPVESWDPEASSISGFCEITSENMIVGRSDLRGGWGHKKPYSIFFALVASRPFKELRMCNQHGNVPGDVSNIVAGPGCRVGAMFDNGEYELELQVGISFVSIANARSYIENEVGGRSFNDCEEEWEGWLQRFQVEGGSSDHQAIFYSLIYRLLCMPTDLGVDEENPFWKSGVRQFTDFYCLWDSIRNANSLLALFAPEEAVAMMNGLLDVAGQTGWLPDAYIANYHAYMQSACAADILFAEAAGKNVTGVDYEQALKYTVKNAEVPSPDVNIKGRYLEDYHRLGYLSTAVGKSCVSRHIEYTYHDWCISRLADKLGHADVARTFKKYSDRIWNLWREEKKMFWPKTPDGAWEENVDPYHESKESWNDPYTYEGPIVTWSLNVFHDFYGMIERMGGSEAFVAYLDTFFADGFYSVKETRMHIPHLYTYAGRPDKASEAVHESIRKSYSNTPRGISDNEDMGCQSGYFIFNSMGIYPIIGQTHYMLTAPLFDKTEMSLGSNGKGLLISSDRKDGGAYIKSASLNNKPLDRAWLKHEEIAGGAELHFVLTDTLPTWGREHLPPAAGQ